MKKRISFAALVAIATAAVLLPVSSVHAQDGTALYVVHGLDLDLPDDSLVTVCADGEALFEFAYGAVELLPAVEGPLDVTVIAGSAPDCEGTPVISAEGFTPEGSTQIVVATFTGVEETGFAVFDVDLLCVPEEFEEEFGEEIAALSLLYATALAPPLYPALDDDISPEPFGFGDIFGGLLPPDDYTYSLFLEPGGDTAIATLDFSAPAGLNTVLAAVGDLDADTVDILQFTVPVGICDEFDPPPAPGPIPTPDRPPAPSPAPSPAPAPAPQSAPAAAARPLALTG